MIEVEGISKRYGEVTALSDVSFRVEKGQIVGFLGANGAGKTTTMDILCGCIGADSGVARVAGFEISEQPREAKRRLGYLPDEPPLHKDMKVREYISYAAKLRQVDAGKRVDEMIDRLALKDVENRLVGNLSKGYRQRVGLAQALVHNPEVLVLDEPTEGLDPNQIAQIRDMIRSFRGEHTIIFSSHILSEVETICDELVIVHKGRVVETGSYDKLLAKLEAGRRYRLRVGSDSARLATELKGFGSLAQVDLVDPEAHTIEFGATGEDQVIDQVARRVLDGGFGLRELALVSKSLEDVFFQLTKNS